MSRDHDLIGKNSRSGRESIPTLKFGSLKKVVVRGQRLFLRWEAQKEVKDRLKNERQQKRRCVRRVKDALFHPSQQGTGCKGDENHAAPRKQHGRNARGC